MKPFNKVVLIVEDDEPKLKSIVEYLTERLPVESAKILSATSLSSAVKALSTEAVDLAIVDLSLPTFDMAPERDGGLPLGFGGADILRFIESETGETRSVVITQYEEFPPGDDGIARDLGRIEAELREELSDRFLGVVHYTGRQGAWRSVLGRHLECIGLGE